MLSSKIKGKMIPLQRLLGRYGAIGAFIAAVSPIPDDIVYIPLGLAKYSPWKFAIATFLGKFVLNEMFVIGAIVFRKTVCKQHDVKFNKHRLLNSSNYRKCCCPRSNNLFCFENRLGKNHWTLVSVDT